MRVIRLKHLALGIGTLLIMSFLYIETQAVNPNKHNQLLNRISQFKQVDAILNQHILEIHQGLLPFYDPIVENIAKLGRLQSKIAEILHQLCTKSLAAIAPRIAAINQLLAQKRGLLEGFKSSHAVLDNSLRYLPLATTEITALLPSNRQGNALRHSLNILLRDTLIYNMISEAGLRAMLNDSTKVLKHASIKYPLQIRDELAILLSHVEIVLENKKRADMLVQQLVSMPIAQSMEKLLQVYSTNHSQMMRNANIYRLALYGFSVLLLCYISYILFNLSQTTATLRRTISDLNYQKFAMDQHAIITVTDSDGIITYANQKFCDISQYKPTELIGQNHRILKSGHHPDSYYKNIWETITQGKVWHGQTQNKAKDGSCYWVETTIVPFMDDKGKPYQYVAIRTDITKIKQVEDTLLESERRLKDAQRMAHIGSWELDLITGRLEWSDEVFRIFEINPQKFSASYEAFLEVIHPDDRERVNAAYTESLKNKTPYKIEHRLRTQDGTIKCVLERCETFFDEEDNPIRSVGTIQDITERRQTEEALRRSQKMEAIGQLSGGIAHDFNNQLGVIIGYLDFLRNYFPEEEKPRKWIDTATRATLRCMDLTRQLLVFSRRQAIEKTVVNINTILEELETMITRSVTPEVMVQYFLADNLWQAETDPGELQDAILNLVINARDAMPNGGKLLIETTNKQLDTDYIAINPGLKPGDYVQLMLSDTGTGMDKETLEHIFEPFFTTKPEGKGTGLGMAMVYGFVKRYDGYIKVYSEPGVGTTIRIYLPCSTAPESTALVQNPHEPTLPTGSESILIVDDEADLLQLADQYLSDLGYSIRTAANATEALEILAEDEEFDLLFSDVVMPGGMNGYELAQQATRQRPGLKVLMTSGFTSKTIAHNGLARFSAHLLSKPYRKTDLAQRIRIVLDKESAP